jgi:hypothetical protein
MTMWVRVAIAGVAAIVSLCAQPAPPSEWDISGAGDSTIQGFTTDISVNLGGTVSFKVASNASYQLVIYRMGYYNGNGASKIATLGPFTASSQPACLTQSSTGLIDCGNWTVTAAWTVPTTAKSGIYFARAVKTTGGGASHIVFVVRDDASHSDILFQTSDTTWQAYNSFGGNSLYTGSPAGRAYKVSYNRPFNTRAGSPEDWVFNAEYPMVRWLELNGYDVSYTTGVDSARRGDLIRNHKVFMSVGHDEYWAGQQRTNVEAARAAGVNLAFLSGNEVFWKTRWENSIAASADAFRTLVCYKETHANAKIDPSPEWTGTWRDPRFSPPSDGGRPENALTGTIFTVNCCTSGIAMRVNAEQGKFRFWRNTNIANLAPGASTTFGNTGILNYEWDEDLDNGFRPPGLFRLSGTTASGVSYLQDYGSTYSSGTAAHAFTLYRHSSGALVFGAGTPQYSWGLDNNHDRGSFAVDGRLQQATVNLLADMGVQPTTLQSGLVPATSSTDTSLPLSTITSPAAGSTIPVSQTTITGTASDTGGIVAAVEVSVDGGATWRRASGTTNWSLVWSPTQTGSVTIMSRAIDDTGNVQSPITSNAVTVGSGSGTCPCTIFGAATPSVIQDSDTSAVELGVKFRSDAAGFISAIRFYKGPNNTGTHVGSLWTATGTRLANVTFANESASGWQQATLATPIAITANTTYIASYNAPVGRYSVDTGYFSTTSTYAPPLRALANGTDGGNGVYAYGPAGSFPNSTWNAANYWVDVVFTTSGSSGPTPPAVTSTTPTDGATGVSSTAAVTVTFNNDINTATVTASTFTLSPAVSASYNVSGKVVTLTPTNPLAASTPYTATVTTEVKDVNGNPLAANYTWSFTTAAAPGTVCTTNCTIWPGSTVPGTIDQGPDGAVELGVKFRSDTGGTITGIRFYKASTNTGTHVGSLWSTTGQRLAFATFTNETASGWQQVNFATPVSITANIVYVASYHTTVGHYSQDENYFATAGVDSPPLHALRSGESGSNSVFAYGVAGTFPTQTYNASNYWVDVVFGSGPAPTLNSIAVTPATPTIQAGATQQFTATGTYSDNSTQDVTSQVTWASSNSAVASINSTGRATGVAAGTSTISATQGSISGSTTLTVQPAPLTVGTTSLPGGTLGIAYSATLTATGGTMPYTWSIISGSLPTGLTLSPSSGSITGTPTATGTATFTVQAADSASQPVTATKNLGIVVSAESSRITGTVTATGSGASVELTGAANATTTADASGNFVFTGLANGTYTVTPTKAGVTFTPTSRSITISGADAVANFTASVVVVNTGFLAPTANAPVITNAGDNNGFETTPENAYATNGAFAMDANSGTNSNSSCTNNGKDKHLFYNYGFDVSTGASIAGIEVQLDARVSGGTATKMCVQLSWNGGTTWTAAQSTSPLTTTTARYTLGGATNLWGRTAWAPADLSNAVFRVRIANVAGSIARTFSLDGLAVRVSYR